MSTPTATTYTVDWGDGTPIETGVPAHGIHLHPWAANGTYTVRVTNETTGKTTVLTMVVTDVEGTDLPLTITASLSSTPPWEVTVTSTEPGRFYDIDWGDGHTETNVLMTEAGLKHSYPKPTGPSATYTITGIRRDTQMTATTTITIDATVPALTVTLTTDKSKRIYTLQVDEPGTTFTVDWGDGSPVANVIIPASGISHTYTTDGAKTIKVTNTVTTKSADSAQDVVGVSPVLTAFVTNQQTFEVTVDTDQK